ncbi:MAG: hypothetical protein WCG85_25520 [Polyangia bacterium]
MKSLASIKTRIADLLAARREQQAQPHVVVVLPDNTRGSDGPLTAPQLTRIAPNSTVILYPATMAAPTDEQIANLVNTSPSTDAATAP